MERGSAADHGKALVLADHGHPFARLQDVAEKAPDARSQRLRDARERRDRGNLVRVPDLRQIALGEPRSKFYLQQSYHMANNFCEVMFNKARHDALPGEIKVILKHVRMQPIRT